ncbi:hypothetical protein BDF19DRAFT_303223 [Syncephalis fuscata]|nr:hypothetical protein BDF19DRAFT_303223 [Syncephalis fuscata]
MSFFSRSNTVEKAASLDMNGAGNKSAEGHDVESDTLLQQINALNQELNANPKSVRLQNDSVQAGTAALFSLARRRIQSRNAFSTNDTNSNHGEIAEEEEDDEIQGVTLNAGGAVNYARRVSTSVYSFA